jgi:hypothetical protein
MVLVPVAVVLGVVMTVVDIVHVIAVLDGFVPTILAVDVLMLLFVDLVDLYLSHGCLLQFLRRHTRI